MAAGSGCVVVSWGIFAADLEMSRLIELGLAVALSCVRGETLWAVL